MILVLLQPAHNDHGHHPIHALDIDRHRTAVNRVRARLLRAHPEARREPRLVARVLAVQEPRAAAPAQDARALAADPGLVVRGRAGAGAPGPARRGLEDDEAGGEGDGYEGGAGEGRQAGVQEVAEVPGVGGGEGVEGEGVALLGEGLDLGVLLESGRGGRV